MKAVEQFVSLHSGTLFSTVWVSSSFTRQASILLLHDSLGSVELWRDFPGQLAAATRRSVIAYDRLGYGKSDPNPQLPDDDVVETEAETVRELLDALDIPRCVLFGHSIGGEMSVACAARLPERIVAVIAESAQCWLEPLTLEAIRAGRAQFDDPEQVEKLRKYHGAKAQWVLDAWTETWLRPSMLSWSILPEARRVQCPVLAIHGDHDGFTSLDQPRALAEATGGRAEIVPGCGHIPHREQPEVVLKLVSEFLKDVE